MPEVGPGPSRWDALRSEDWLVLGGIGVVLFALGGFLPWIPGLRAYSGWPQFLLTVPGGVLAAVGIGGWYDRRRRPHPPTSERSRELEFASSFEIYSPKGGPRSPPRRRS